MEIHIDKIEADILTLNRTAMSLLKDQNFSKALSNLKQASKLASTIGVSQKRSKLQGITLNNFGCVYKRSKMPKVALKFLTKACDKEKEAYIDSTGLAATHLNMCAIYSELNKHHLALEEGLTALSLMKTTPDHSPNFISTLVIAYFNTGVEYEFLSNNKEAYKCYQAAWEQSEKYLGALHPLTLNVRDNCLGVEKKLKEKNSTDLNETSKDMSKKEVIMRNTNNRFKSAGRRQTKQENKKHSKNFTFAEVQPPVFEKEEHLRNVRFLTGERLQPMFKSNIRVKSLPRGAVKIRTKEKTVQKIPLKINSSILQYSKKDEKNIYDLNEIEQLLRENTQGLTEFEQKNREKGTKKLVKVLKKSIVKKSWKKWKILKIEKKWKDRRMELDTIPEIPDALTPLSEERDFSLKVLQAVVKGYAVRKHLKKHEEAIIKIQKNVRRYQVMKIYRQIHEAIVFIQRYYRDYLKRRPN